MATTTFVPIELYLRTSYRPDVDYVDGVIEERNWGAKRSFSVAGRDFGMVSSAGS